jgi:hypothetical protein
MFSVGASLARDIQDLALPQKEIFREQGSLLQVARVAAFCIVGMTLGGYWVIILGSHPLCRFCGGY